MPSSKLRSSDTCIKLIEISPGTEHLEITGCRLPTYEQVLLSYMSNMNKIRSENASNKQKLKGVVSNIVAQQVLRHYQKAGIASKPLKVIKDDVQKVQIEYEQINKKKNPKRISEFRQKLRKTIPLWKKNTINDMKSSLSSPIPLADKQMIKTDIEFLQSMMSDRLATYASMDLSNSIRKEKRYARQEQEETSIDKLVPGCAQFSLFLARFQSSKYQISENFTKRFGFSQFSLFLVNFGCFLVKKRPKNAEIQKKFFCSIFFC